MAKRKKKKQTSNLSSWFANLKEDTMSGVWAVLFLVVALFLVIAAMGYAGVAGSGVYGGLSYLLGVGYFLLPFLASLLSLTFFQAFENPLGPLKAATAFIFLLSGLGLIELVTAGYGGLVGNLIASPLIALFDTFGSLLILVATSTVSLLITFEVHPTVSFNGLIDLFRREDKEDEEYDEEEEEYEDEEEDEEEGEEEEDSPAGEEGEEPQDEEKGLFGFGKKKRAISALFGPYSPPPMSLLERDRGKPGVGDIKANANLIKRTLQNFGINVEIDEISIGPTVTRYALKPAEGVRLSKIVALQTNLELALAAHPVRIEAPIPGKSLVGIEIPNSTKTTVGLASLLPDEQFTGSNKPLLVSLGKDITGSTHFADLAKMPHLLIAGATGAGKSVMIHSIITSLLYRTSPELMRFVMVDPKRVELTLYNSIPHLLTPVITNAKKTILALKWLANEMDRRYDILEAESVRDISSYHENVFKPAKATAEKSGEGGGEEVELPEAMPYIVVIIDELADIMQAYPRELESAVVRLAQMSRAVGIHLILSTQRPSVKVITGLIKANIPARIALQVSSQIDSRTILDMGGAEKLLGAGDMLYLSGEMSKPRRIQSPLITEIEVKKVVKHLAEAYEDEILEEVNFTDTSNIGDKAVLDSGHDNEDDELYDDAYQIVLDAGKASTSYLQRKLRVGYARAARLMDMLEENGVIGEADGSKPREVLVDKEGHQSKDTDEEEYENEIDDEEDDDDSEDKHAS